MAVFIDVKVIPRSARSGLAGTRDGMLLIRLNAPPVEGAANDALVDFLASVLGIARRDVTIVAGSTSRSKIVELTGITEDRVRALLDT